MKIKIKNSKQFLFIFLISFIYFIFIIWNTKVNLFIEKYLITDKIPYNKETLELTPDIYTLLVYNFNTGRENYIFDQSRYEHNGMITSSSLWYTYSPFKGALNFKNKNFLKIKDVPFDPFSPTKLNISDSLTIEMILYIKKNNPINHYTLL